MRRQQGKDTLQQTLLPSDGENETLVLPCRIARALFPSFSRAEECNEIGNKKTTVTSIHHLSRALSSAANAAAAALGGGCSVQEGLFFFFFFK
jgi:hypothetical protein